MIPNNMSMISSFLSNKLVFHKCFLNAHIMNDKRNNFSLLVGLRAKTRFDP